MVNFVWDKGSANAVPQFGEVSVMSETLATPTKESYARNGSTDLRIIARVEKWMAMIREINREQQTESKARG